MYQSGHTFNEQSLKELAMVSPALRLVILDALRVSDVPFQIRKGGGPRTIEQQRAFAEPNAEGKIRSKVHPDHDANGLPWKSQAHFFAAAKHVVGPEMPLARAVDIVCAVKGKEFDREHLAHIAGVILACARFRETPVRWGGNFDRDGEILEQAFDDMPHFELDA